VDWSLAAIEGGQFGLVIVDHDDLVAKIGEARSCHQPDVSRPYYRDLHARLLTDKPQNKCAK
jgi:hypothetical protein